MENGCRLRRIVSDPWSCASVLTLVATLTATTWVFGFSPELCGGIYRGGVRLVTASHLLCLMHWLDTIALISTFIWSLLGFIGVYFGPEPLWDLGKQLGKGFFLLASFVYFMAMASCLVGVFMVWSERTNYHLGCVISTELLFFVFDCILIRKINSWHYRGSADNVDAAEKEQLLAILPNALKKKRQLWAWVLYVDMPAFMAFLVLLLSSNYLRFQGVLINNAETEIFAAGAVFFGLMAANLAFFSANMIYESLSS